MTFCRRDAEAQAFTFQLNSSSSSEPFWQRLGFACVFLDFLD
jgi:hypothetical protein